MSGGDTSFKRGVFPGDVPHLAIVQKKLQSQIDNSGGVPGPPGPQGNPGPPGAQGLPGAGIVNYSLAEQRLGIGWVDGRPVYQTTLDLGPLAFGTAGNPGNTVVNHGIPNIQRYVELNAFMYLVADPTNFFPLPFTNNQGYAAVQMTSTYVGVTISIIGASGWNGYATFRYTCTDR